MRKCNVPRGVTGVLAEGLAEGLVTMMIARVAVIGGSLAPGDFLAQVPGLPGLLLLGRLLPPRHRHRRPTAAQAQLEGELLVHQTVVLVGQVLENVLPKQNT